MHEFNGKRSTDAAASPACSATWPTSATLCSSLSVVPSADGAFGRRVRERIARWRRQPDAADVGQVVWRRLGTGSVSAGAAWPWSAWEIVDPGGTILSRMSVDTVTSAAPGWDFRWSRVRGDRRGDRRMLHDECEREMNERQSGVSGQLRQCVGGLELAFVVGSGQPEPGRQPGAAS